MSAPTAAFMLKLLKDNFHKLSMKQLIDLEVATRGEMANREFEDRSVSDRRYIETAIDIHHKDGELEIDEISAIVSTSEDPGAYVQAWVWVYDTDVKEFRKRQRMANHGAGSTKSPADVGSH